MNETKEEENCFEEGILYSLDKVVGVRNDHEPLNTAGKLGYLGA